MWIIVRPEFTDTLAIKEGRHPILDKISTDKRLVGNDVVKFIFIFLYYFTYDKLKRIALIAYFSISSECTISKTLIFCIMLI